MIVTSSNYEKYRKIYCKYMYDFFEDYISLECDYCPYTCIYGISEWLESEEENELF